MKKLKGKKLIFKKIFVIVVDNRTYIIFNMLIDSKPESESTIIFILIVGWETTGQSQEIIELDK